MGEGMNKETFENIKSKITDFSYTSLNYTDYEEISEYEILCNNEEIILLYGYNKERGFKEYHWASNSVNKILNLIDKNDQEVLVSFVPAEWVEEFKCSGFRIYAVFHDYDNPDISHIEETKAPELLTEADCEAASGVTLSCYEQSRGFHGETADWMKRWIKNEEPANLETGAKNCAVLVHREAGVNVGIVCTATYAHESAKGPVAWIREVAVRPEYQNRGIARQLICQALNYGKKHGAVRAFLMADECNEHAIHLYQKLGFAAKEDDGQIDMLRRQAYGS
jgi:GNAT superfamily N-acetyltransferase